MLQKLASFNYAHFGRRCSEISRGTFQPHQNFNQFLLETTQFEDTVLSALSVQYKSYVDLLVICP